MEIATASVYKMVTENIEEEVECLQKKHPPGSSNSQPVVTNRKSSVLDKIDQISRRQSHIIKILLLIMATILLLFELYKSFSDNSNKE